MTYRNNGPADCVYLYDCIFLGEDYEVSRR